MDYALTAAYAAALLYLGFTDLREGRIPNRVVLPAAGVALLEAVLAGTWRSDLVGGGRDQHQGRDVVQRGLNRPQYVYGGAFMTQFF